MADRGGSVRAAAGGAAFGGLVGLALVAGSCYVETATPGPASAEKATGAEREPGAASEPAPASRAGVPASRRGTPGRAGPEGDGDGAAGSRARLMIGQTGSCLVAEGASEGDGAPIVTGACEHTWRLDPDRGTYHLVAAHSGLCLDASEEPIRPGTPMVQRPCDEGRTQKWMIRDEQGGGHVLQSVHSRLCLGLADDGDHVVQGGCSGDDTIGFRLVGPDGGAVEFDSAGPMTSDGPGEAAHDAPGDWPQDD